MPKIQRWKQIFKPERKKIIKNGLLKNQAPVPPKTLLREEFFQALTKKMACSTAILHQVLSSVGVCLCHFASAMVVGCRVCAILHQVWSSVGVFVPVVSWRVWAILHQVWSSVGVSVPIWISYGRQLACLCHFASGMVVRRRVCAILHQVWSSVDVFVPFCIRYGRQRAWLCHFASGMVVSWRVCVILH